MTRRRRSSPPYDDLILSTPGLVGYWKLNERSGTVARDSFGSNHGTYVNGPTLGVPGLLADGDTAVTFAAASSQYVSLAGTGFPMGSAARTLLVWVKTNNAARQAFFGYGNGTAFLACNIEFVPTYKWFFVGYGGGDLAVTTGPAANDGSVHFLGVSFDGAVVNCFADGLLQGTAARALNTSALGLPSIGRQSFDDGGEFWNTTGTIARPAIFNRALTPGEIADLYRCGIGA